MDSVVKVVLYVIIGATVIAVLDSSQTAPAVSALTGGFANILNAMRGGGSSSGASAGYVAGQQTASGGSTLPVMNLGQSGAQSFIQQIQAGTGAQP